MKPIAKKSLTKNDITNLIDMALENKIPWNSLAHLLKDVTTYDPKQVIDTLLKVLEELHLKTQEKSLDVDDIEGVNELE